MYCDTVIDVDNIVMLKSYEALSALLQHPDDSEEWQLNFNRLAVMIEERDEENSENLPFENTTVPWYCETENEKNILFSPPIVHGKKAVRLSVPVTTVGNGTHINARVHVLDANLRPIKSNFACLTTTQMSLLSIFTVWDTVARMGTREALRAGIITEGWIYNVFHNIRCDKRAYDSYSQLGRYARGSELSPRNLELIHLERQLQINGIPLSAVHGEGWRDKAGRYYNSWFDGNYCTACKRHYRPPSRAYPNSYLAHVKTIKHRRNAAIFLLKQLGVQADDDEKNNKDAS